MRKNNIFLIVLLTMFMQGCIALHFQNEKGFKAKANTSDIKTKGGNIDKADGKANYWSMLDIWIPWKWDSEEK